MSNQNTIILTSPEQLQQLIEAAVRAALSGLQEQNSIDDDRPLNPEEAAAYLNVSLSTLYRYTSQRIIPHQKAGGKNLTFFRRELDDWLRENRKLTRKQIEAGDEFLPKSKASKTRR